MYEAELIQVYDEVFNQLNLDVEIVFNNRKILAGIAEVAGIAPLFSEMTISIDKMDKIGKEGVINDLGRRGIDASTAESILEMLDTNELDDLEKLLEKSETGLNGIEEIRKVYQFIENLQLENKLIFDPSLARGLNYYTGCIFEVKAIDGNIGSVGGGGRYAELTEVFGRQGMSGVGVSFGAERIYDLMLEKNLFPASLNAVIDVLFVSFDEKSHRFAFSKATELRKSGIKADVYPEAVKMKKQMKYANAQGVPYVVVIGDEEMESGLLAFKNMIDGGQEKLSIESIRSKILDG